MSPFRQKRSVSIKSKPKTTNRQMVMSMVNDPMVKFKSTVFA
jgi:hypothetical protein